MGNAYTTEMNSTYHSLSTNERGDNRWSSFEYYPFKHGNNRNVYKGISFKSNVELKQSTETENDKYYEEGISHYWTKQKCVVKSIKTSDFDLNDANNENSYWFRKLRVTGSDYAIMFEKESQSGNKMPKIVFVKSYLTKVDNMSSFWNNICNMFRSRKKRVFEGDFVLIEDRIYGKFETMIDENGEKRNKNYLTEVLKAFLHFTYHKSEGKLVICGFQGVMDSDENYWLTTPTIHSADESFGPKDRGNEGIQEVFSHHFCGEYCKKEWTKP